MIALNPNTVVVIRGMVMEQYLHMLESWGVILFLPYCEREGKRMTDISCDLLRGETLQAMYQLLRQICSLLFRVTAQSADETADEVCQACQAQPCSHQPITYLLMWSDAIYTVMFPGFI